ncbi:MAG: PDZ domain-containing protein [Kiritimatiellae bacterium]|nr:PDZ domain-containing protein [Kiritimatiellia bacterium]
MTTKLAAAVFCAALALGSVAGEETAKPKTAKELAAEQHARVERFGKSAGTVRYWLKKNADGLEPKFDIPYVCPCCGKDHWRNAGVSVANGIPAEFACFVLSPDEVVMQDLAIDPEFVDRIEVSVAGETRSAVESEACPEACALILKTSAPFTKAVPLDFTGKGEPADPSYFWIVRENGETVSSVSKSGASSSRHHVEANADVYDGKPNTLVLDENGEPVTVAFQTKIVLGGEIFTPPSSWKRESASLRCERKRAFEEGLKKSILPAYIQLEAAPKEGGAMQSIVLFSMGDEPAQQQDDIDTYVILVEDLAIIPVSLDPKATARLSRIEATLPDGSKARLEFVGSLADRGGMVVKFADGLPDGLQPLKVDSRRAIEFFGKPVRVAAVVNKAGSIVIKSGVAEIWKFERAKGNVVRTEADRVNGLGLEENVRSQAAKGFSFSDAGILGMTLSDRRAGKMDNGNDAIEGAELYALVKSPVYDSENVPRSVEDRKRTPWLGVEVQTAGADVLREKKANSYFRSFDAERAALVTEVAPNSPARRLGILKGDVLLSVKYPGGDEQKLLNERDMLSAIDWNDAFGSERFIEVANSGQLTPWPNAEGGINGVLAENFAVGSEVVVAWISDGKRREGVCKLDLAPPHFSNAPRTRSRELEMTVCDMTHEVRQYFKFNNASPGVVVAKVKGGGLAAVAGIRPLELILEVNGEPVTCAKDFADKTKGKKELMFKVRRLGSTRMVPIRIDREADAE